MWYVPTLAYLWYLVPRVQSAKSRIQAHTIPDYYELPYVVPTYVSPRSIVESAAYAFSPTWHAIAINTYNNLVFNFNGNIIAIVAISTDRVVRARPFPVMLVTLLAAFCSCAFPCHVACGIHECAVPMTWWCSSPFYGSMMKLLIKKQCECVRLWIMCLCLVIIVCVLCCTSHVASAVGGKKSCWPPL